MNDLAIKAIAALALVAGLISGYGAWHHHVFAQGEASKQAEWDAEKQQAETQAEVLRLARQSAIDKSANKFATHAAKARETVASNLSKVDNYAPNNFPPLPGSFRVWHDAAAAGEEVDDSARANAASVSLKAAETTIADNYASCNYDKQRLEALQDIVRAMQ